MAAAVKPSASLEARDGKVHRDLDQHWIEAGDGPMKSNIVKRSIVIAGHKTSVSLEDAFWKGIKDIAGEHDMKLSELIVSIDSTRQHSNLSSAIRLFVLDHYRGKLKKNIGERPATRELMASEAAS